MNILKGNQTETAVIFVRYIIVICFIFSFYSIMILFFNSVRNHKP